MASRSNTAQSVVLSSCTKIDQQATPFRRLCSPSLHQILPSITSFSFEERKNNAIEILKVHHALDSYSPFTRKVRQDLLSEAFIHEVLLGEQCDVVSITGGRNSKDAPLSLSCSQRFTISAELQGVVIWYLASAEKRKGAGMAHIEHLFSLYPNHAIALQTQNPIVYKIFHHVAERYDAVVYPSYEKNEHNLLREYSLVMQALAEVHPNMYAVNEEGIRKGFGNPVYRQGAEPTLEIKNFRDRQISQLFSRLNKERGDMFLLVALPKKYLEKIVKMREKTLLGLESF